MNLLVFVFFSSVALATAFPDILKGDDHDDNGGLFKETSEIGESIYEDESSRGKVGSSPIDRLFNLWGGDSEEKTGQILNEENCDEEGSFPYSQKPQLPAIAGLFQYLLGLGKAAPLHQNYGHQVAFRKVPIAVPHPYPVQVIRRFPVPIPHPLPYFVHRPYPVYISRPYPVAIPRPVPYQVLRRIPYPVYVPHRVRIPHPYHVNVPRWFPYYVPVPMPHQVQEKVPAFEHFSGGEGQGRNEGGAEGENEKGKVGDDERD